MDMRNSLVSQHLSGLFSMLDITRFAKLLALAGSDMDGEALAALRKANAMLRAAKLSFTDVAQSVAVGNGVGQEAERLQKRVAELEEHLFNCLEQITEYEQELRRAQSSGPPHTGSLKRTRAEIAAKMRDLLGDAHLSVLSDREIARCTGLSPQTVGNWRRRLEAERAASRRTVHHGRKRAA
jgi:hypothetical protein